MFGINLVPIFLLDMDDELHKLASVFNVFLYVFDKNVDEGELAPLYHLHGLPESLAVYKRRQDL